MNTKDGISIKGYVKYVHKDKYGNIKAETAFEPNGIPNSALAAISGLLGNTGSQVAFTYLALGTGSTAFAASQTALVTEITDSGLARTSATVSRTTTTQTNDTLQLTYTWTASGSKTVTEVGIFNASSGGVMLGRKVLSSASIVSGDTFAITYNVVAS